MGHMRELQRLYKPISMSQATTDSPINSSTDANDSSASQANARKRPKPGERRVQILQALASMLEQPGAERVTTAALAAKLDVSEAALYRHFASKAQMFEGLIEFIEQSVLGLSTKLLSEKHLATHRPAKWCRCSCSLARKIQAWRA